MPGGELEPSDFSKQFLLSIRQRKAAQDKQRKERDRLRHRLAHQQRELVDEAKKRAQTQALHRAMLEEAGGI
ncbi:hypothetical protein KIPB_000857 [Kipferlia bialata]|uniref:Uncharacterized protein n=1 Tax=Kipferlia bialata TaxID=797122 RepID=A0A9K3GFE4_9EUKA|nr:hypothetical protein KIPB_000857 [Kipferlia bialata]|eukprot:g857.t1